MSGQHEILMGQRMDGDVRQEIGVVEWAFRAIMNSHDAKDRPKPGERLKIGVGG